MGEAHWRTGRLFHPSGGEMASYRSPVAIILTTFAILALAGIALLASRPTEVALASSDGIVAEVPDEIKAQLKEMGSKVKATDGVFHADPLKAIPEEKPAKVVKATIEVPPISALQTNCLKLKAFLNNVEDDLDDFGGENVVGKGVWNLISHVRSDKATSPEGCEKQYRKFKKAAKELEDSDASIPGGMSSAVIDSMEVNDGVIADLSELIGKRANPVYKNTFVLSGPATGLKDQPGDWINKKLIVKHSQFVRSVNSLMQKYGDSFKPTVLSKYDQAKVDLVTAHCQEKANNVAGLKYGCRDLKERPECSANEACIWLKPWDGTVPVTAEVAFASLAE